MEPTESSLDIRDLLWKVRQYRYLILLPIVASLCGAFVFYKVSTPLYESYALVSLGDRATMGPALEPLVRADRDAGGTTRDRVSILDSRIHGRAFLQVLVNRLGILRTPEVEKLSREYAAQWQGVSMDEFMLRSAVSLIGRKISIVPSTGTLARIVAVDASPVQAKVLASAVADLLVEQSRQSTLERAQARGTFSADQISIYQDRLRKAEDDLRAYQESLIGRNLQAGLINDGNLDVARNLIRLNEEEMEQIRNRVASEHRTWFDEAGGGPAVVPDLTNGSTANMESRLEELEVSYGVAALGADKAAGDVSALGGKVTSLRQELLSQFESNANALPGGLSDRARMAAAGIALDRAILRSLRAKGARLTNLVASFAKGIRSSPRDQMQLERLRSDVETNRALVANLQKEATSSRLSEALETSELGVQLEVVESPQVPLFPVSPSRVKIFGGALLLGPLLGISLIVAMEKLGAVIRSVEQAEQEIGVRVIGTVPRVEGWSRPGSFLRNHWAPISILLVLLLTGIFYTVQSAIQPEHRSARPATVERR